MSEEFMSYDPWRGVTSRNGIPGDELISALQKSIRKGKAEIACRVAYEMYITSEQFEDKLWRRLSAISCEDIGFGDVMAPVVVDTLDRIRKKFPYTDGDRPLFFFHAIRYLASRSKERSTDCLKNIIIKEFENGYVPEIPDYAYDMHTGKGRELGRDINHFLDVASAVTPLMEGYDDSYRQQLKEMIKKEQEGTLEKKECVTQPFAYNTWQH